MQAAEKESLFKEVMGNYPTGVTVVTSTSKEGEPVGLTVNSFASVSLDPMLILWSIDHDVSSLEEFKNASGFVVHILAGDQQELCKTFASKKDRFQYTDWSLSKYSFPILTNTFSVIQCNTFKQVEAGDHTILIGEVVDIQIDRNKEPMMYHRRKFGPIPSEFYVE